MAVLNDIGCPRCGDEREVMTSIKGRGESAVLLERKPDGEMVEAICTQCNEAMRVVYRKAPSFGGRIAEPHHAHRVVGVTETTASFSQGGETLAIAPAAILERDDGARAVAINFSGIEAVPPRSEMN